MFSKCCLTLGGGLPKTTPKPVIPSGGSTSQCGIASNGWRITAGSQAVPGQFPWQVSLRFYRQHVCGGTLVDEDTIVTAAHCVAMDGGLAASMWTAVIGETNIAYATMQYRIRKVWQYPYWTEFRGGDIAIMKLATKVRFTQNQLPACIPSANMRPLVGETCYVSGWGQTNTVGDMNQPTTTSLLHVGVKIVDTNNCRRRFRNIDDGNICAGGHTRKNACRGDSGGPLVCYRSGRWYLQGIVSFGSMPCGQVGTPGVYTRVTSYADLINRQRQLL